MEKKKVAPSQIVISLLLLVVIFMQYRQGSAVSQVSEGSTGGDDFHQSEARYLRDELINIKSRIRVLAYNQQRNVDLSGLAAGNRTVKETMSLPILGTVGWKDDRLTVSIGEEIKTTDLLFGLSLRKGLVIANHKRRSASSYDGELAHPLADLFILVQYRQGTFEQNGQMMSGVPPIARWMTSLQPIDRSW